MYKSGKFWVAAGLTALSVGWFPHLLKC
ncbi:KxYKxGKxW signal peptide domain-containing protein [Weissella confusa]|nr:KxYKxGKxW signal peptide domain-containing protein [Weissella confusa]